MLNGALTQSGGKIVADTAYLHGGADQTGGAVEIGSLRFVNAGYDVSLSSAGNKIGNVHGTVKNLALVDSEGGIVIGKSGLPESQNSLIVNGNAEITANGGGITQDGKISVAADDATFKADGDIALDHGWNVFGGKVNADGGNILVAAGANVANMTLGDVKATGDARAKVLAGDLTVDGGVDADGNVRLESVEGGVIVSGTVNGNNVTLAAANGITENAAVNAAADKYVHATDGNINVNATATVGGDVAYVATAKVVTDNGASIGSTGGGTTYKSDSSGTVVSTGGSVTSKDGVTTFKDASVVAIDTTDSVVVNNDGVKVTVGEIAGGVSVAEVLADPSGGPAADGTDTVALDSSSASGITAKDVTITVAGDPGDVAVSVEKAIATTDGDVSIETEKGDVNIQADVVATGGDVTVDAGDSIMVDSTGAISGKSVALTANGTGDGKGIQIAGGVSATDGTLDITATGADGIALTGTVTADNGATTLTADNGAISAANAANDFQSVIATAGGNIVLNDKNGIKLDEVTATAGDVRVRAMTDNLTVADGTGDTVTGQDIRLEATEGAIEVGAGVSGKNVTLVAGSTVETKADGALTATGGDLYINAGGDVTLGAAQTATEVAGDGGVMAVVSGGKITATEATTAKTLFTKDADGVSFTDVNVESMTAKTGGDMAMNFVKDVEVAFDAAGSVSVTADGSITVSKKTIADGDFTVTEVTYPTGTTENDLAIASGISIEIDGITAGTAANLAATGDGHDITVKTQVTGGTGVTLTSEKGDVNIGTSVDADAVVKAGKFDIPTAPDTKPTIADGDSANLAITAGNGVTAMNGAKVGSSGTSTVAANGDKGVTFSGSDIASKGAMTISATKADVGSVRIFSSHVASDDTLGLNAAKDVAVSADANVESTLDMTVAATSGNVTVSGSRLGTNAKMTIGQIGGNVEIKESATLLAAEDVDIDATGAVTVDAATIAAKGDVLVGETGDATKRSGSFTAQNDATVTADGNVSVYVNGDAKVDNATAKAGNFTVDANGNVDETASDYTVGNLTIDAGNAAKVTNGAQVGASGTVTVTAKSVEVDASVLAANDNLEVTASDGSITLETATVAAHGTATLTASADIAARDSTIVAEKTVSLDAGNDVKVEGTTKVGSDDNVVVKAGNDVTVETGAKVLAADKGTADNAISVTATSGDVTVAGEVVASKDGVAVNAGSDIEVSGAVAASEGDVALTADKDDIKVLGVGSVAAQKGDVVATATAGLVDVSGTVKATQIGSSDKGTVTLVGNGADDGDGVNVTGIVEGDLGVTLTAAKDVVVNGGTVKAGKFDVPTTPDTKPTIADDDNANLSIAAGNGVTVQNGAMVGASGTADITADGDSGIVFNGSAVASKGAMTVSATKADTGSVNIDASHVATEGTLGITAAKDVNATSSAVVESTGDMTVAATSGDVTVGAEARVGTDGNLEITAGGTTGIKAYGILVADKDGKTTTLTAANGAIDAQNEKNDFKSVTATAERVAMQDTDEVALTQVTATKGDVGVTAGGTITVDGAVSATKDADGTGNVTLIATADDVVINGSGSVAADATATVTAAKDISVSGTVAAKDGNVTIEAKEGKIEVVDGKALAVADGDAGTSGSVIMTAKTSVDVKAGAEVKADTAVAVTAQDGAGDITIDGSTVEAKDIVVVNQNGAVSVKDVSTVKANGDSNGNIAIYAEGDNGNVTIDTGVTLSAGQNLTIDAAKDVTLNSGATAGAEADAGDAVVIAKDGSVTMKSGTTLAAEKGNVVVNGKSGIALAAVKASTDSGTVYVKSADGSITDANNDTAVNVTAKNAAFDAANGAVGTGANHVETSVDVLAATSKGGVFLTESDGVTVGEVAAISVTKVKADGTTETHSTSPVSGLTSTEGTVVLVAGGKTTVDKAVNAGANVLVQATSGGIEQDADITAGRNASVIATAGNIDQNANITATAGTIDVEATGGDVKMADGTSAKTDANGNIRYRAGGDIAMETIDAGTGAVMLDADGDLTMASDDAGVTADGLAVKANAVGTADDKMKFSVSKIAVDSATDVYIDNDKSLIVTSAGGDGDAFKVVRVKPDGSNGSAYSSEIDGVVAKGGDVDLDVVGEDSNLTVDSGSSVSSTGMTDVHAGGNVNVNGTVGGGDVTVEAGGGIAFDADGSVSGSDVTLTAQNGDITQQNATVAATGGYVEEGKSAVNAAVNASGTATLTAANGSIGKVGSGTADYVGVEGSVVAKAGGDVAVADAFGDGLAVGEGGIEGGKAAAVLTAGSISGDGTIKAPNVTVSAKSFDDDKVPVKVSAGNSLTVNNFRSGMNPLLAVFESDGGNARPELSNLPNKTVVFFDGRLLGGDLKTINTVGAVEAFPVQTPELKSEQGIFGNPTFLHNELDVSNPMAVGAIDFILLEIPRLTLSDDFPLEVERHVAAAGLNPTTTYWFGQSGEEKSGDEEKNDESK